MKLRNAYISIIAINLIQMFSSLGNAYSNNLYGELGLGINALRSHQQELSSGGHKIIYLKEDLERLLENDPQRGLKILRKTESNYYSWDIALNYQLMGGLKFNQRYLIFLSVDGDIFRDKNILSKKVTVINHLLGFGLRHLIIANARHPMYFGWKLGLKSWQVFGINNHNAMYGVGGELGGGIYLTKKIIVALNLGYGKIKEKISTERFLMYTKSWNLSVSLQYAIF